MDYKHFIKFLNTKYHENIFPCYANVLCLLNIYIQHILKLKNIIADSLFQVIFNKFNSFPTKLVGKLIKEIFYIEMILNGSKSWT